MAEATARCGASRAALAGRQRVERNTRIEESGYALTWQVDRVRLAAVKSFTAVVEKCPDTRLYVGYIPGFAGAHSQGDSLDELRRNLEEVVGMLLEDG